MTICTPDLYDQYGDTLQIAEPVFQHFGAVTAFGGPVKTLRCFEDNSKVGELLRSPGEGRVLVVDGGGSRRFALLGDQLAEHGVNNGWAGVVINGLVRDVELLAGMQLGIMALGAIPRKTEKRGAGDVDVVIEMPGFIAAPGQYLYADRSGIVVADHPLIG